SLRGVMLALAGTPPKSTGSCATSALSRPHVTLLLLCWVMVLWSLGATLGVVETAAQCRLSLKQWSESSRPQ
ncbi:unnamed protein product, partial [Symbiodinium pilosum]